MSDLYCARCGHPMYRTLTGVTGHLTDDEHRAPDQEQDADHVPFSDDEYGAL